jgi:small-conductance mechanosensitive channel
MIRPLRTFLASAWLLALHPAAAQESGPPPPAPVASTPVAIPTAEIPARAEAAMTQLRTLAEQLKTEAGVTEIKAALPERERLLDEARQRDSGRMSRFGLRQLEDVRQSWLRRKSEVEAWSAVVQARLDTVAQDQKTLDAMEAEWRATRASLHPGTKPPLLEQRTRAVVAELARTRTALNTQFDELLALQDRILRLELLADQTLKDVDDATAAARNALLHLDSPPLWEAFRGGDGSKVSLGAQFRESVAGVRQALAEWYQAYKPQLGAQIVIFLLLTLLTVMLHRRTRDWSRDDASVKAALHVLDRPVSAALLISLMFTPWLYPRAGVAVRELWALLLMIPLLRVLPALVYRPMRAPLYVLAIPYFLSRLHAVALPRSTLDRLLLLLVTAITFVGLVMLIRLGATKARDSVRASGWWRAAVWVMRLGWLSLAVAIVANVVGAVALAEVLVAGTLASTLVAGVLLAGLLVIRGVIAILLRTKRAQSLRSVSLYGSLIEQRVARFLYLAALVLWLYVAFNLLNVFGPVVGALKSAITARWSVGSFDLSLGDMIAFFASIYAALLVSRFVRFLLQEDVFPRLPLARGVPNTITMLVNYAIVGIGLLLALSVAGFDLTRLTIIAGALSVGIGFGLQNVVNNFVSGLILAFERPVQIGDVIEVGKNTGEVRRIGIRSSTIRTAQGAEVIVPNGNLIASEVVNWTLSDRDRRLELKVGVAYGNDPAEVIELLRTTVLKHPKVRADQPPIITFDGFGESSLDFTLRYWSKFDDSLFVGSEVATAVYQALTAAGIDIPAPRRDLRVLAADRAPAQALALAPAQPAQAPPAATTAEATPAPVTESAWSPSKPTA